MPLSVDVIVSRYYPRELQGLKRVTTLMLRLITIRYDITLAAPLTTTPFPRTPFPLSHRPFTCPSPTMVQNNQEPRREYWATR